MFTVNTQHVSMGDGSSRVVAKSNGRQRTVKVDLSKSERWNHGAAAGTLLAALLTDEQKAKVAHPSGMQRLSVESLSDAGGKYRFTVNV